jgi:hypothetical protein
VDEVFFELVREVRKASGFPDGEKKKKKGKHLMLFLPLK